MMIFAESTLQSPSLSIFANSSISFGHNAKRISLSFYILYTKIYLFTIFYEESAAISNLTFTINLKFKTHI